MKHHLSAEAKLSLKISAAISGIMILLFVGFTWILGVNLTKEKGKTLEENFQKITSYLSSSEENIQQLESAFLDLSWYVEYSLFDKDGKTIAASNYILPKLPAGNKKPLHYMEKNFYTDGNLDVLYLTTELAGGQTLQVSMDIETDSASKMIFSMPKIIPFIILPLFFISFLILLFFIKKDFEQEHNFSANVSHELQTPVNAILGHAKLLDRWGKNDPVQTEKSLKTIISEAKSMKSTITNLLQITKLEKKMIELEKVPLSVNELFGNLKTEFNYEEKLEINFEQTDINISTDPDMLHQIFVIVISNSLKFCGDHCVITLGASREGNRTILEITDNGKGFSEEILPYIFDRFYRGDAAHSRSKGGAGLGLSIAKSIASALDCRIEAKNAPAGGACIRLEF